MGDVRWRSRTAYPGARRASRRMTGVADAKILLGSAEHNHEKPQNEYDHARANAKADAAKVNADTVLNYFKAFGTKQ